MVETTKFSANWEWPSGLKQTNKFNEVQKPLAKIKKIQKKILKVQSIYHIDIGSTINV